MAGKLAAKTILIIDDDDDTAQTLAWIMEKAGYQVRRANDGAKGVRMVAEQKPDLILLDFMMPEKDGFAACHEIRQIPGLANLPIIAVTSFGETIGEVYDVARKDAPMNICDYLEKPVEPNVLLARISSALAGSTPRRTAQPG